MKRSKMQILIVALILPFIASSQIIITGKVIDKTTKLGVPYATIGLYRTNVGINADENGSFILKIAASNSADTLLISSVGYKSKFAPVGVDLLELEQIKKTLNEVVVKSKLIWTFDTLHKLSNKPDMLLGSNGHQTQVAQPLISPVKNGILTEVIIQRENNPAKTIFRLRVYDRDSSTKGPSEELCDQIIQVESRKSLIIINLEDYKIRVPNYEFFVAVEWLKIPFNQFKFKAKLNGKPLKEIRYMPYIGMTNGEPKNLGPWFLDYNNEWRPMFENVNNPRGVLISATIKY